MANHAIGQDALVGQMQATIASSTRPGLAEWVKFIAPAMNTSTAK